LRRFDASKSAQLETIVLRHRSGFRSFDPIQLIDLDETDVITMLQLRVLCDMMW